ncbi:uncharacterized protein FA14DRAFT_171658 [Meira miltonrushii]|uniref:Uncharacterized protein n=1 Tax=Meira miltonrushii TaxID=1280837 RepID=A0A316VBM7_9BASI|nr:uncharacterized protein FA14DRAFT_171658 [Meira miltonrushii]PWN34936.1 hypothetical protein FA14DRAFT_171658 [Meira miltonrushii]
MMLRTGSMKTILILLFARLTNLIVLGVSPRQTGNQPPSPKAALPDLNEVPQPDHDIAGHEAMQPIHILESTQHASEQVNREDPLKKERRMMLRRINAKKFYAALPPEKKKARSRQVSMNHKARFASWSEEQKEEFRVKQKEAKVKHYSNPSPRPYEKRKGQHDLTTHGDTPPSVQSPALPNLNELPPSEPENRSTGQSTTKRKQDAAGLAEHDPAQTEAMKPAKKKKTPSYHKLTPEGKSARNHKVYVRHREKYNTWSLRDQISEFQQSKAVNFAYDHESPEEEQAQCAITRLSSVEVLAVSPRQTENRALSTETAIPDLNETPQTYHHVAGDQAIQPIHIDDSAKHTSPAPIQLNTEDAVAKKKRLMQRRKYEQEYYAALSPEKKQARSRQISMQHKARFASWSEEEKQEFRKKQGEAKKKSFHNPTPRPYKRTKGQHDSTSLGDGQPAVHNPALLNLNEMPPSEHKSSPTSQTTRKRKQDAAGLAEHSSTEPMQLNTEDALKRRRKYEQKLYAALSPEKKEARSRQISMQQKARFASMVSESMIADVEE